MVVNKLNNRRKPDSILFRERVSLDNHEVYFQIASIIFGFILTLVWAFGFDFFWLIIIVVIGIAAKKRLNAVGRLHLKQTNENLTLNLEGPNLESQSLQGPLYIRFWWRYSGPHRETHNSKTLLLVATDKEGNQIKLREDLNPWQSVPGFWSYFPKKSADDGTVFMLNGLEQLTNLLCQEEVVVFKSPQMR